MNRDAFVSYHPRDDGQLKLNRTMPQSIIGKRNSEIVLDGGGSSPPPMRENPSPFVKSSVASTSGDNLNSINSFTTATTTTSVETTVKSPPVSPRSSMALNNNFLNFPSWGKTNALKEKSKPKRTPTKHLPEKHAKVSGGEDQVEGVPWGLPKAMKSKVPDMGVTSTAVNKRRVSERPEVRPNAHCHVIVGDQWKKLRKALENPKFDEPLTPEEEVLSYDGSVSLSNHISLFVLDRSSFRQQGGGEIKLIFNTDYEIRWVRKETEFEEGHLLLVAFSINLMKYFAQSEPFQLLYAMGAKKKFDFKKVCRLFGRSFKLLLQKNNLRAVKKAFSSTIQVTYENPLVAEVADELPRIKVLNLHWRNPYVLLSRQGVGSMRGVEMPMPHIVLAAPNLEEVLMSSSYYQRLVQKVAANPKMICGKSISTYPCNPSTNLICDTYLAKVYDNFALLVIADGCNWGIYSAMAAQFATLGFVRYIEEHLVHQSKRSSQAVGEILLAALQFAHKNIVESHKQYLKSKSLPLEIPAGTTTLLGGVIVPVANEEASFLLMTASVGDCKCYRISTNGKVTDLTKGTRSSPDACDPGGRLGPYIEDKNPDLRNMGLCMALVQPGDIIAMVSDGVHDNFDPKMTGENPEDWGLPSFDIYEKQPALIDVHKEKRAEETITKESYASAEDVVETVINYSWKTTESSRVWMEENPRLKLPVDYQQFPGKMDHSTCLAFQMFSPPENTRRNSIPISDLNPPCFISFEDKFIYEPPLSENSSTIENLRMQRIIEERNQTIAAQKEQITLLEKALKDQNITPAGTPRRDPPLGVLEATESEEEFSDIGSIDFRNNVNLLVDVMEENHSKAS